MEQATSAGEAVVQRQVSPNRRSEIRRYLKLFGYKPERTVLQVHMAGSFGHRPTRPDERLRLKAARRGAVRTFVVIGRCHDPSILQCLSPPRPSRNPPNPGYLGYLFVGKDKEFKAPDERLPLDFVPTSLVYPGDWKDMFNTRGFMIAMHVPTDFATSKNEIQRRLNRIKGAVDPKEEWKFIDELEEYGYFARKRERAPEQMSTA